MYELEQVGENTFYINCPAKIGVFRLPDGGALLIDSGNDKDAAKKALKVLAENGMTPSVVINTHSNADHAGGNKLIADRTGCRIYSSGVESAFCRYPVLEPSFLYGGFPCKPLRNKFLMAEPSPVNDITALDLPAGVEVFPLPGHYFGMLGVKTPDGVCFIADCLFSAEILGKYHLTFIYDVAEYLKTLDMIKTMDAKMFIPAHAGAAADIRPLVCVNQNKVHEIIKNIGDICEKPAASDEILAALFDNYGLTMDFNQYVLGGSTVRSYLSYMFDCGMLKAEFAGNRLLWRK